MGDVRETVWEERDDISEFVYWSIGQLVTTYGEFENEGIGVIVEDIENAWLNLVSDPWENKDSYIEILVWEIWENSKYTIACIKCCRSHCRLSYEWKRYENNRKSQQLINISQEYQIIKWHSINQKQTCLNNKKPTPQITPETASRRCRHINKNKTEINKHTPYNIRIGSSSYT